MRFKFPRILPYSVILTGVVGANLIDRCGPVQSLRIGSIFHVIPARECREQPHEDPFRETEPTSWGRSAIPVMVTSTATSIAAMVTDFGLEPRPST